MELQHLHFYGIIHQFFEDQFNLITGNYEVTITEANGCETVESFAVIGLGQLTITGVDIIDPCKIGGVTAEVPLLNIINGVSPYSYNWTNGTYSTPTSSNTINNLYPGLWELTVTDANGCSGSISFVVTCLEITLRLTNSSCEGICNGEAEVQATNNPLNQPSTPSTFEWSTGETTQTITNLCPGNYSVTVYDTNGYAGYIDFTIGIEYGISLVTSVVPETCPGVCDGEVEFDIVYIPLQIPPPSPFTLELSSSQNTYTIPFGILTTDEFVNVCSGIYNLELTDANGCFANSNGIEVVPSLYVDYTLTANTCSNANSSVFIDLTVTSNNNLPSFFYTWSNGASNQDIVTTDPLPHNYTVTITDGTCTIVESIIVDAVSTTDVEVLLDPFHPTCFNLNNGEITAIASGGNSSYTYLWSTFENTMTISNLSTGLYLVTVTDSYGCSATNLIELGELYFMTIELDPTPITCADANGISDPGSIELSVSNGLAPYSYIWSNSEITQDIDNLAVGVYSVTVTDSYNCQLSGTAEILANQILIEFDVLGQGCDPLNPNNGQITTTITGGTAPYSYLWDPGSATTSGIYNLNDNNTYTVEVTDAIGCSGTATTTVMSEQDIDLVVGWSLMSTYIDIGGSDMSTQFTNNGLAQEISIVKSQAGSVYWPAFNLNQLPCFVNGEGYQIKMFSQQTWHVDGSLLCPEDNPISLDAAWNFIAYLRIEPLSAVDVFSGISTDVALVKDGDGDSYWPYWGVNMIGNMMPGEGYQVYMVNANTLIYPANSNPLGTKLAFHTDNFKSNSFNIFKSDGILNTGSSMVLGIPLQSWDILPLSGDEIGIFGENNQLVGHSIFNGEFTPVNIWGDDITTFYVQEGLSVGESFTISVGNPSTKSVREFKVKSWKEGNNKFEEGKISVVGFDENNLENIIENNLKIVVFPNPGTGMFYMNLYSDVELLGNILIYNTNGQIVYEIKRVGLIDGWKQFELNLSSLPSGLYNLQLKCNGNINQEKVIIIK